MGVAGTSAFGAQTASAQANSSAVVQSTSSIQSDEIGNITNVDDMELVWEGRQLQSIGANGTPYFSYEYNIDGQRTKKTVTDFDTGETTTTEYFYNGSTLAGQKTGSDVLVFMYDESGDMFGFTYNGTPYYYVKNAQNDVWAVTNADGQAVVLYFYDAWGNVTRSYEADGYEAIAEVNPILYRSYYCDLELGFYYLNTRYYVPTLHRFLNADSYVQTGQGMLDKNMFAYCANNPVLYTDADGESYTVSISAEGPPNVTLSGDTEGAHIIVEPTGGVYTVTIATPPTASRSSSSNSVGSIGGAAFKAIFSEETKASLKAFLNAQLAKSASPLLSPWQSVKTFFTSGSIASMASFAVSILCDYSKYGGNTSDFLKAVAISAGAVALGAVAIAAVGALVSTAGLPTIVTTVAGIGISASISLGSDWLKRKWIGY